MKKGFTLVELLAVIVILAIIALITTISVSSIISDSKEELSETQIKNIERSAEAYYIKEGMDINNTCISVSELLSKGYIQGKSVKDPKTKEEMVGFVKVTLEGNQYSYTYQEDSCSTCSVVSGDKNTVGSEISCAGENFYLMSNDGTNITMLAKYNLNVGEKLYESAPEGNQNENIIGPVWIDDVYSANLSYGMVPFSNEAYWINGEYSPAGDSNFNYVYDNNSTLFEYVEAYENYLIDKLGFESISAKLMSYEQAEDLGCVGNDLSCAAAPSWVYLTKYWLGSTAYGDPQSEALNNMMWGISTTKIFGQLTCTISNGAGLRPVITIPTNKIK